MKIWLKIVLNAVRLPKFEPVNGISWSPRKIMSADAGLLVITANMQSETGFPSSHQLKSYVAYKSRLKLAARAVLSADAGLLVKFSKVMQQHT